MIEETETSPQSGDLAGRVVLITGGTRGIGLGLARALGAMGMRLAVTGRKPDRVADTEALLNDAGVEHMAAAIDVRDADGTNAFVADIMKRWGRLDGLVANAQSFRPVTPLTDVTDADMNTLFDTGPKGTLWSMQAVHPPMVAAGRGRIVTMATSLGLTGAPGYGPYAASNEAIRSLTRTAAREWGPAGITANCVLPASVAHRLPPTGDGDRQSVFDEMYADQPLGRDGDPETDIAPLVAFLLSDASQFVTGQSISADGGGVLRP